MFKIRFTDIDDKVILFLSSPAQGEDGTDSIISCHMTHEQAAKLAKQLDYVTTKAKNYGEKHLQHNQPQAATT